MSSVVTTLGIRSHLQLVGSLEPAAQALAAYPAQVDACPSNQLGSLLGLLSRLRALVDVAQVITIREAAARGIIAESDAASPADWVSAQTLGPDGVPAAGSAAISQADAAMLGRIAIGCAKPCWTVLDQAVVSGTVSPRAADRIVKEHGRLTDLLPESMHEDVLSGFVALAASGASLADLGRFREGILARYGPEGHLQIRHDRLATHRSMTAFARDLDGMYHAVLTLDPESHAIVTAVLDPLSAPVSGSDADDRPTPDERTADQRRADALIEVCSAYQRAGSRVRLGTCTRLVVTMSLDQLRAGVGSASTPAGDVLAPGTVRRLACDATIIPMVLGSKSEPVDVGREERLATPAQLMALRHRDRGCTFPGCIRPPGWTQAHHIRHWLDHGSTDVSNLTLLCRHHHTIVHRRGYTATVSPTDVTWHVDRDPPSNRADPASHVDDDARSDGPQTD